MEKIKELLNQISKIVVEEKTQQEERRKRGENFNIFKVLGLSSSRSVYIQLSWQNSLIQMVIMG